jgi:hypothetical protein
MWPLSCYLIIIYLHDGQSGGHQSFQQYSGNRRNHTSSCFSKRRALEAGQGKERRVLFAEKETKSPTDHPADRIAEQADKSCQPVGFRFNDGVVHLGRQRHV